MDTAQESSTERRRRQNRLNQQARRKRLADEANAIGLGRKWIIYSASAGRGDGGTTSEGQTYLCQRTASDRRRLLEKLKRLVAQNFLQKSLDAAALTSVTRYNVCHAIMVNATYLGLTMELLREDITSPFNVVGPAPFGSDPSSLSPSLRPTSLQRQIVHHPWVDLCPMPSLRDALLVGAAVYDEDELCHDLFMGSSGNGSQQQAGLVVWGESWDPSAYELSEATLKKWQWLLVDCTDLLDSTNFWRAKRCMRPLRLGFRAEARTLEAT